jgi:hypothetical protein
MNVSEARHASGILCSLAREYTTTIYDREGGEFISIY